MKVVFNFKENEFLNLTTNSSLTKEFKLFNLNDDSMFME